jgi:HTH-type transcriptional regulator, competence development regulator
MLKYLAYICQDLTTSINVMANQFGKKIRQLREDNNLLLREVAGQIGIDVPMLSKIEHGERLAKKCLVGQLARILNSSIDELLPLWLADRLLEILEDEHFALKAIMLAEEEVKFVTRSR